MSETDNQKITEEEVKDAFQPQQDGEEEVIAYDESLAPGQTDSDDEEEVIQSPAEKKEAPVPISVLLQNFKRVDIQKQIADRITELGGGTDEASVRKGRMLFEQNASDTNSVDYALLISESLYSKEVERALKYLERLKPKEIPNKEFTYRYREEGASVSSLRAARVGPPKARGDVSGEQATLVFNTFGPGGIRNIMLYNSMISIDVRRPTIDEIQVLLNDLQGDFDQYGGELGAQYYLFEGYLLFKHFVNFIFKLIVRCSLRDWRDRDQAVLMQAIQLNDYNLILTEIAHMMYPEGFPHFQHICQRPKDDAHPNGCKKRTELKLKINELPHVEFSKIPKECKDFLSKSSLTAIANNSLDEVLEMQKRLGFGEDITVGRLRFRISPPSLYSHVEAGQAIYAAILEETQGADAVRKFSAVATKAVRFWLPWVEYLQLLPEEGMTEDDVFTTRDKNVISSELDKLLENPKQAKRFEDSLTNIVDSSNLTFIGYRTPTCSCGYEGSGFSGVDAQTAFFTMGMVKYQNALSMEMDDEIMML